jgi:hypothetical protein
MKTIREKVYPEKPRGARKEQAPLSKIENGAIDSINESSG